MIADKHEGQTWGRSRKALKSDKADAAVTTSFATEATSAAAKGRREVVASSTLEDVETVAMAVPRVLDAASPS